jgi:serine/threonine protein kinase
VDKVRHILREAALALGHAHRRHVVHRDVKPANIMLDTEGRIVLTDFGISKALEGTTQITGTGTIIGTPAYMAPEQAKGRKVDGRADQYSLAIVGYRALTGKLPFEGDPQSILYQQVHESPPSLLERRRDTPRDLQLALERGLSKQPGARFPTMEEFAASVSGERAAISSGTTTVVAGPPTVPRAQGNADGSHNSGVLVVVGTLIALVAAVLIGIPRLESLASRGSAPPAVAQKVIQRATLNVRSTPSSVLFIDGVKAGRTPISRRLTPGTYRLRLEQKGYRTVAETVVMKGTRAVSRQYEMRPQRRR